jgi:hypothetical protein
MGRLLKIALLLLVLHAAWRVGGAWWTSLQFQDEVARIARFEGHREEQALRTLVVQAARAREVLLSSEVIDVRRDGKDTTILAAYTAQVEVLPRYYYPWVFQISSEGWTFKLPERSVQQ